MKQFKKYYDYLKFKEKGRKLLVFHIDHQKRKQWCLRLLSIEIFFEYIDLTIKWLMLLHFSYMMTPKKHWLWKSSSFHTCMTLQRDHTILNKPE